MHQRQAIREAVVARLTGTAPTYAIPSVGARIFKSRMAPIPQAQLPAINVYTQEEQVDPDSAATAPRELRRVAIVAVEAWVKASSNVDDALDTLSEAIETVMDADYCLGGTAFDSTLLSTEIMLSMEGERPLGCVHLEYTVTYHSDRRVVAPTDNFDTLDVRTRVPGVTDEDDEAHDVVSEIYDGS